MVIVNNNMWRTPNKSCSGSNGGMESSIKWQNCPGYLYGLSQEHIFKMCKER